jgi:hypothetical protein
MRIPDDDFLDNVAKVSSMKALSVGPAVPGGGLATSVMVSG